MICLICLRCALAVAQKVRTAGPSSRRLPISASTHIRFDPPVGKGTATRKSGNLVDGAAHRKPRYPGPGATHRQTVFSRGGSGDAAQILGGVALVPGGEDEEVARVFDEVLVVVVRGVADDAAVVPPGVGVDGGARRCRGLPHLSS